MRNVWHLRTRTVFKRLQYVILCVSTIKYLIVVFDDFYNVAAVAAQSSVTAAFNMISKLYISSIFLGLVLWYGKDKVNLLIRNSAPNLIDGWIILKQIITTHTHTHMHT